MLKKFINGLNLNMVEQPKNSEVVPEKSSVKRWTNRENAIIIGAIIDNNSSVNVDYVGMLLPERSESAIRNKILEYAKIMHFFALETTNKHNSKDNFDDFRARMQSAQMRVGIISWFFVFGIFSDKTPQIIIDNFWVFNDIEEI